MIEVEISARAGDFVLNAAFQARAPGVVCVFGPSGAGKTTLLRAIAGLETPLSGKIAIDGVVLHDSAAGIALAAEARRVGYVFQDSRLFPHLNVRENLIYGLKRAPTQTLALEDVVEALGIGALLERAPRALSGGERQRVALGRALLAQPRLILMDEPLAGVDAARKSDIIGLIQTVRARFGASILYVSHDLDETAALADDLVLIEHGAVTAYGPAATLFADPDLKPLADRADVRTLLDLPLLEANAGHGLSAYGIAGARLLAPPAERAPLTRFQIYARDVTLALAAPTDISVRNMIAADITSLRARPDGQVLVALSTPLGAMLSIVTADAVSALALAPGRSAIALVKAAALR